MKNVVLLIFMLCTILMTAAGCGQPKQDNMKPTSTPAQTQQISSLQTDTLTMDAGEIKDNVYTSKDGLYKINVLDDMKVVMGDDKNAVIQTEDESLVLGYMINNAISVYDTKEALVEGLVEMGVTSEKIQKFEVSSNDLYKSMKYEVIDSEQGSKEYVQAYDFGDDTKMQAIGIVTDDDDAKYEQIKACVDSFKFTAQ